MFTVKMNKALSGPAAGCGLGGEQSCEQFRERNSEYM